MLEGEIKFCTISKTRAGNYYISMLVEEDIEFVVATELDDVLNKM